MKHIDTWLNEEQYKAYVKNAEKLGLTEYAVTKKLIVDFLDKRRERNQKFLILYFFILYSLVTTAILFFIL